MSDLSECLGRGVSRKGIAARTGQHAVGEGLLAGLAERDERGGAESELAAPATDDQSLDPASGSGWLNEQVQTRRQGSVNRTILVKC